MMHSTLWPGIGLRLLRLVSYPSFCTVSVHCWISKASNPKEPLLSVRHVFPPGLRLIKASGMPRLLSGRITCPRISPKLSYSGDWQDPNARAMRPDRARAGMRRMRFMGY